MPDLPKDQMPRDEDVQMAPPGGERNEPAPASQGRDNRKKKVRVVNRRGPSEIDKAIRASQAMKEQSRVAARKTPDKGVARGTIIRVDKAKGFGFVIDSAGEHRFFHRSAVLDGGFAALKEQQLVEFEPHNDERGARALKVRPAGSAPRGEKPATSPRPSRNVSKASAWRSDLSPFRNGGGSPNSPKKW